MGMGEEQIIDGGGIKAEVFRVFLPEFTSALIHAAIDEDTATGAFDHMA